MSAPTEFYESIRETERLEGELRTARKRHASLLVALDSINSEIRNYKQFQDAIMAGTHHWCQEDFKDLKYYNEVRQHDWKNLQKRILQASERMYKLSRELDSVNVEIRSLEFQLSRSRTGV